MIGLAFATSYSFPAYDTSMNRHESKKGTKVRITYPDGTEERTAVGAVVAESNTIVIIELDTPLRPVEGVLIRRVVRQRSEVERLRERAMQ